MSAANVARRYATALFEVAADRETRHRVREELARVAEAASHPDVQRVLVNPRFTGEQKRRVADAVGRHLAVSSPVLNLLGSLIEHGRGGDIAAVAGVFGEMVDAAEGRLDVTVTAATDLPPQLRTRLDERLVRILGADIDINHRVDPQIIGGLVIQMGTRVFDSSIRSQLSQLRQAL